MSAANIDDQYWFAANLSKVADVRTGTRVTKKRDAGSIYPVYGGGGATFRMDEYNRENCFIVSRFGMSEECVRYVDGKFFLNDSGLTVDTKDSELLNQRFLDIYLLSKQHDIYRLGRGTAQKNLNVSAFKEMSIEFPNLHEQKRIVAVLDQAFAALDRSRAHAESNLVNANELLYQAREQLLSRNQPGWEEKLLADLITVKHGFAFKSKHFQNEGTYVLLTPGNFFERGGFRHRGKKQKYYLGEIPDGFILNEGDLLMAMTEQAPGLLGSCILVPEDNRFLHNQRLGLIEPKNPENWHSPYFAHVFNLRAFRKALSDSCTGIKVRHTSPDKIRSTKVPVPPNVDAQEAIAKQIDQIAATSENLAKAYSTKLDQIETLQNSLLHQAFSGHLT